MITLNQTTYSIDERYISVPVSSSSHKLIEGDANSTIVKFRIQRYASGVDLSTKDIYVCYQTDDKTTGRTLCNQAEKNNKILTFTWTVPPEATHVPGTLIYHIDFDTIEDNVCTYRLKTMDSTLKVTESFDVLSNSIASDYVAEKLFLLENPNRVYHDELVGCGYTYKVTDKTIEFNANNRIVAIVNDNMSCLLQFRLPRFYDGVDRKDMTFCFTYINANGDGDISCGCNISYTNTEIFVGWALDSKVTNTHGDVRFKIGVLGHLSNEDFYVWYTDEAKFQVKNTINVCTLLDEPDFDWYYSWQVEADNILKQASNLCNQVKEYYNTIQTNKEDFADYVNAAQKSAEAAANLAEDFSSITCSRLNMDTDKIFQRLLYKRKDDSNYMESLLIATEGSEYNYDSVRTTYYNTKKCRVIFFYHTNYQR